MSKLFFHAFPIVCISLCCRAFTTTSEEDVGFWREQGSSFRWHCILNSYLTKTTCVNLEAIRSKVLYLSSPCSIPLHQHVLISQGWLSPTSVDGWGPQWLCVHVPLAPRLSCIDHICIWNALFVSVWIWFLMPIFAHVGSSAWSMQSKVEIRWYNYPPSELRWVCFPNGKISLGPNGLLQVILEPCLWKYIWVSSLVPCSVCLLPCGAKPTNGFQTYIYIILLELYICTIYFMISNIYFLITNAIYNQRKFSGKLPIYELLGSNSSSSSSS